MTRKSLGIRSDRGSLERPCRRCRRRTARRACRSDDTRPRTRPRPRGRRHPSRRIGRCGRRCHIPGRGRSSRPHTPARTFPHGTPRPRDSRCCSGTRNGIRPRVGPRHRRSALRTHCRRSCRRRRTPGRRHRGKRTDRRSWRSRTGRGSSRRAYRRCLRDMADQQSRSPGIDLRAVPIRRGIGRRLRRIVGVAVAAAHGIRNQTLDLAGRPAGAVATDGVAGTVVVAATIFAALAFVRDLDAGAARFARVAVSHPVDAAHRIEDIRANAGLAEARTTARVGTVLDRTTLALVGAGALVRTGAPALAVRAPRRRRDRLRRRRRSRRFGRRCRRPGRLRDALHVARRAALAVAADRAGRAVAVAAAIASAFAFVRDFDTGAAGFALVGVGLAVDPAHRRVDARAHAGLAAAFTVV